MYEDQINLDREGVKETAEGWIVPLTFAAEITQRYGDKVAYKSADELIKSVNDMRQRKVPLVIQHPESEDGTWTHRPTVGYTIPESVFFDFNSNKSKGSALIFKGNEWVMEGILQGKWDNVSIGFTCQDLYEAGEFNGIPFDFRQTDIITDHIALCEVGRCPSPICGVFADSNHKDVEVTENYVRIPISSKNESAEVRTITISPKGIKALIQIIGGRSKVITYLFDKTKWTLEKAKEWVSSHKQPASSADNAQNTALVNEVKMANDNDKEDQKVDKTPAEPPQKDCDEKMDSLVAEYEKKFADLATTSKDSIDKIKEEIKADFQKKFDELLEGQKKEDKTDKDKDDKKEDAKTNDALPPTGVKSVKPPSKNEDDIDFEALKAKRQDTYMWAERKE